MRFLFLESFFSGSHKDFALGLIEHSKHNIDLVTLPGECWKWRMKSAALEFLTKVDNFEQYHGILATDMINLADFKAITKQPVPPIALYFHENQLTYPQSPRHSFDADYGFINITSALVAQKVLFNSYFHFNEFMSFLDEFINKMPGNRLHWIKRQIIKKAQVLHPGCRFSSEIKILPESQKKIPLIIWNHRWEYDKNPEDFFKALRILKQKKIKFQIAVLGEEQDVILESFVNAEKEFNNEILTFGYVDSKEKYINWLAQGDIVVSTSIQENFGISIIEAVRMGCMPLLPKRLSYPEIIPEEYHSKILYSSQREFVEKLEHALLNIDNYTLLRNKLSIHMNKFSWEKMISQYDKELELLSEWSKK